MANVATKLPKPGSMDRTPAWHPSRVWEDGFLHMLDYLPAV